VSQTQQGESPQVKIQAPRRRGRVHRGLTLALQAVLLLGASLALVQGQWQASGMTLGVVVVTFLPVMLGRRFQVQIPPEFESLAVVFIFASLFLGEVRGYYLRFWWWDVLLHTGSGFLMGILAFLLVHVLNEKKEIGLHLTPRFVALFAFMFALGMGALWEILEFGVDAVFGLNMQKSGLVDTMWDLIVDTVGALVISILGWIYLRRAGSDSFLEEWIANFIESNPRMFGRQE